MLNETPSQLIMKYKINKSIWVSYGDDDISMTASEIYEKDDRPIKTGLLDANGEALYRYEDKLPFGFVKS